jgi:hypothetical protein
MDKLVAFLTRDPTLQGSEMLCKIDHLKYLGITQRTVNLEQLMCNANYDLLKLSTTACHRLHSSG